MTSPSRRILSVLCAVALAMGMTPTAAFAETARPTDAGNNGSERASLQEEPAVLNIETSVLSKDISLFALDQTGQVALKEGTFTRWIDRIDIPDYVLPFYEVLQEAVDGDGNRDYLIDDKYFTGNAADDSLYKNYQTGDRRLKVCEQQCSSLADKDNKNAEASRYALAVMAAFDRDHPEVFWLSNTSVVLGSYSYNEKTGAGTLTTYLLLKGQASINGEQTDVDIRADRYRSESSIKADISLRDAKVKDILQSLPRNWDKADAIWLFNKWLTRNNEYNTVTSAGGEGYKEAHECISALDGREGQQGPVCEGYARAFKVLCDRVEIPCVLVDGDAGGPHMWNYTQIDNLWYGVDVTWNDPTQGSGKDSGNENADWLLVGAETKPSLGSATFESSHPVTNRVGENTPAFPNGPELTKERYNFAAIEDCSNDIHVLAEIKYNNDAGCTKDGTESGCCLYCNARFTQVRANTALGHAFGAYRYNNDARVNIDGTETATCSRCGAKTTRTAAGTALKPAPSPSVVAPPSSGSTSPSVGSALAPAVGQTVAVAGSAYAVTGSATVAYAGPAAGATSATIPATVTISGRTYQVTSFDPKAFAGNKKLKSVKIGANIKAVPVGAFKGCTALTSVSFGANVQTIGKQAFSGCKALKSVTLGSKVASIGDGAFQNCAKLTKVTVKSAKLKTIGKNAFSGCKKLGTITLKTTKLKSVGKNALKSTKAKLTVKVPKSKVKAYQKLFKNKGSKTVRVRK